MNRKIISTILSVVFLATFVLSCLSGCSAAEDKNHYTVLQWLDKVEQTFNLLYYSEKEPLIKSVKASDDGFETVQIAVEWGIISPEDDLKFNDRLTKELAADTLVRAMNCVTPSTVEISDSKNVKPLYLENVMSSVNEGIFALKSGKFDPKKQLSISEADGALITAHNKWINFSYGESFDRSVIKENVINLGGVASENSPAVQAKYSVEYTGSRTFFDENGGYTDNTGKTITFPANQVPPGLAVDTVLAMPADDVVPMNYAVVVTGIKTNDDGSVTVSTRNAELHEVYEEIDIQQSGPLDFSEAVFYGPDGQRLTFDDYDTPTVMSQTVGEMNAESLGFNHNTSKASDMKLTTLSSYRPAGIKTVGADNKAYTSFKLGEGLNITISRPTNKNETGIGFKIEGEVEDDGNKVSIEVGFDENIKVENRLKTHWDWFQLKVDELKLSMTETKTETFGFSCSLVKNFGKTINKYGDHNDNGKFDVGPDWAKDAHKLRKIYGDTKKVGQSFKSLAAKAKEASNKKLLDIILPGPNLHFVIRAELTVEGSVMITLTQSNMVGVEMVKGKLRPIHEETNSQQTDFSAKIELAFRAALEIQLIGINVADLGVKAGIGAKVSSIIYSCDKATGTLMEVCGIEGAAVSPGTTINAGNGVQIAQTGLQIQTDETRTDRICSEFSVYPILSFFCCSSSSVAGSLLGTIELKVLSEDTPFLMVHYETNENGGGVVSECSMSANENYGITTGDKLTLNMNEYAIAVSDEGDTGLAVKTVPKNASIKDITISSDNTDVLEVENLLHKVTMESFPQASPELEINFAIQDFILPNKTKGEQSFGITHKFGTWFYQDMSENANPQFALIGKKNGKANVTITVGGESVTVPVQVGTGIESVVSTGALVSTKSTFTLAPGETAQTAFDFIPEEKTIADISFTSANSSVATVSSGGLITAVGTGDTVITATLRGKNKDYSTTFTVHVIA